MRPLLALFACLAAGPVSAQLCPGDCNGDGAVTIDELILGVRISLGDAALAACPAFDATPDGVLRIDELVRGVAAASDGCPATPTPSRTPTPADTPTSTPTATATPTGTATATPTVPPVAGRWRESTLTVDASSCAEPLTTAFAAELAARGPCEQEVVSSGELTVRVSDCSGQMTDGTVDRDGTIRLAFPPDANTVDGCTVTLSTSAVIPAATSPTTARYTFDISFDGACTLDACVLDASAEWRRL